jgi:hypothetical protein
MTGWTRLVIVLVAFIGIFASENKRIEQGTRAALDEYASLCPGWPNREKCEKGATKAQLDYQRSQENPFITGAFAALLALIALTICRWIWLGFLPGSRTRAVPTNGGASGSTNRSGSGS